MFLRPSETVLCGAVAIATGAGALVACLAIETSPVLTAILPVGFGVGMRQVMLAVMTRRAWHRENNARH